MEETIEKTVEETTEKAVFRNKTIEKAVKSRCGIMAILNQKDYMEYIEKQEKKYEKERCNAIYSIEYLEKALGIMKNLGYGSVSIRMIGKHLPIAIMNGNSVVEISPQTGRGESKSADEKCPVCDKNDVSYYIVHQSKYYNCMDCSYNWEVEGGLKEKGNRGLEF